MKISCPNCSALQTAQPNDQQEPFIKCENCQKSLYIDIGGIVPLYTFSIQIDAEAAAVCLKRHFQNLDFNEPFELLGTVPRFLPFWRQDNGNLLDRGSSHFPGATIPMYAGEKFSFSAEGAIKKQIEVCDIDTQPPTPAKLTLFYVPYFQLTIRFHQQDYTFFINAVSGDVVGDPIPYVPPKTAFKLFPLYFLVFIVFIAININIHNMLTVFLLCLCFLLLFFFGALQVQRRGGGSS